MARALGLPAVLGVPGLLERAHSGTAIVIDGSAGLVIADPAPRDSLDYYRQRQQDLAREERHFGRLRRVAAVTRDGIEVRLEANPGLLIEVEQALARRGRAWTGAQQFLFLEPRDPAGRR
jgi:phosphotransferase system enzyme I (PtsI)